MRNEEPQPLSLQPAYALHTRDYRETSLIVEFFTPAHGRVAAVARGARSVRRGASQRAILQPLQPLWIELGGHGELKSLRNAEARAAVVALRGPRLFGALYLNELLCRLLHRDDAHDALFARYEATLQALAGAALLDVALRHFEIDLLDALGYGFSLLEASDSGAPLAADARYEFDPQRGLVSAPAHNDAALRGGDILDFAAGRYSAESRRALKRLCRLALRPHLGSKPLRSRELFVAAR